MIHLFTFNTLKVSHQAEHGFYLEGNEEWGDILLPNKDVPEDLQVGDQIEVFLHYDHSDRIIATTREPFAEVGEFALLEVASNESIGVFLDWGLEKQLFVPKSEQLFRMKVGESYVVFVYVDRSGRVAATTRLDGRLSKEKPPYKGGEAVNLLVYQQTDLGFKAVVDGEFEGLLFKGEHLNHLKPGMQLKGYIKFVHDNHKIDLLIQPEGLVGRGDLSDLILEKLKEAGGRLEVTSKSSADVILDMFGVSRKKFKVALGHLYKKRLITIDDKGIRLP